MTLGKYSLEKVVDVCDCFEISRLEQFLVEERCACVTHHGGVSFACPIFSLDPEGSKEGAATASVPSAEELPGKGKCAVRKKLV